MLKVTYIDAVEPKRTVVAVRSKDGVSSIVRVSKTMLIALMQSNIPSSHGITTVSPRYYQIPAGSQHLTNLVDLILCCIGTPTAARILDEKWSLVYEGDFDFTLRITA